MRRKNFRDSQTFQADIGLFMSAWIFRTSWPKMVAFSSKIGGKDGAILTPNEFFLTFKNYYLTAEFGENQSRNATARVQTHGQTVRQMQSSFIICPSYSIAMGQITYYLQMSYEVKKNFYGYSCTALFTLNCESVFVPISYHALVSDGLR